MQGKYQIYKHCLIWEGDPTQERHLSQKEAKELLKESKAWFLRNCYDWDCEGPTNFWYIIQDTFFPIKQLKTKVRNQVRRGLKECEFKLITKEELVTSNGYIVYKESFERYSNVTISIPSKNEWERATLSSTYDNIWGVFLKETNTLIAYGINKIRENAVFYSVLKAIPKYLNYYPLYGLIYTMNQYYLQKLSYDYVCDGARSVTEHSNIQPFLEQKFNFRKAYCKLSIYYKWWLKMLITLTYPFKNLNILPLKLRNLLKFEEIHRELNVLEKYF